MANTRSSCNQELDLRDLYERLNDIETAIRSFEQLQRVVEKSPRGSVISRVLQLGCLDADRAPVI